MTGELTVAKSQCWPSQWKGEKQVSRQYSENKRRFAFASSAYTLILCHRRFKSIMKDIFFSFQGQLDELKSTVF